MRIKKLLATTCALAALVGSVSAFDITNGVDITLNPITAPNNVPLSAGQFTLRLGYFNFSTDLATNNAMILANQNNLATLNANFVQLFNFDAAEQAEGDTGAFSNDTVRNPNGEVGALAGGTGLMYAYLKTTDVVWNAAPYTGFQGRQVYAWIQLTANQSQQAVFTSTTSFTFNAGNNPFDPATNFVISEDNPDLNVLIGFDRTGTAFNDFQLVPEPSSVALAAIGGIGFLTLLRRRRRA